VEDAKVGVPVLHLAKAKKIDGFSYIPRRTPDRKRGSVGDDSSIEYGTNHTSDTSNARVPLETNDASYTHVLREANDASHTHVPRETNDASHTSIPVEKGYGPSTKTDSTKEATFCRKAQTTDAAYSQKTHVIAGGPAYLRANVSVESEIS
jgi:hypothetical protein